MNYFSKCPQDNNTSFSIYFLTNYVFISPVTLFLKNCLFLVEKGI